MLFREGGLESSLVGSRLGRDQKERAESERYEGGNFHADGART